MALRIVWIPELEYLPGGADALPQGLWRMLGRARRVEGSPHALLAEALAVPEVPAPAVLSKLGSAAESEPFDLERYWLRCDAIVLLPDLTAVWVEHPIAMDVCSDRFAGLADQLAAMFGDAGLTWHPLPGQTFSLLEMSRAPDVRFAAPHEIAGRRLDDVLPTGPDAPRWHRLINASQMIFHQYRSLASADQRGLGLWFWGGGPMLPASAAEVSVIADPDDAIVRGLASWLGGPVTENIATWREGDANGVKLLFWPLSGGDPVGRLAHLVDDALHPFAKGQLLILGSLGGWYVRARDRLLFWRKPAPAGFVGDAA